MRRLIPNFLTGAYKVTRMSAGYYKDGRYVPGDTETLTIRGSLQPIGGREIKLLEEGERVKDHFFFYSNEPLSIIDTKALGRSDVMEINGETYKVIDVEGWQNQPGFGGHTLPHYKTRLYREPQT